MLSINKQAYKDEIMGQINLIEKYLKNKQITFLIKLRIIFSIRKLEVMCT